MRTERKAIAIAIAIALTIGFGAGLSGCATDPDGNVVLDTVALREVFVLAQEIYEYMELMEARQELPDNEQDPDYLAELKALGDEVIAYWQTAEGQAEILAAVEEFRRRFEEMQK